MRHTYSTMAAHKHLILLAFILLLSAGAAAAAREDDVGAAVGKDEMCQPGCTDAYWNCNDRCLKLGYRSGTCYRPPLPYQCCCSQLGPYTLTERQGIYITKYTEMAVMFPAMCKNLVVVTLVALLFFAGVEAASLDTDSSTPPLDSNTPPFESDYYICQSIRSGMIKPNCSAWCRRMGKPNGGYISGGSCCCNG
ncbi:hypothetical protein U9M48_001390 [Paspalum notatum var. saurae]|uniref:Uncharacterized protein n=1 Tax=Paspalum notatum var. saurae TaxID=547442 RepID=A0AAQ3SIX4_PASNO